MLESYSFLFVLSLSRNCIALSTMQQIAAVPILAQCELLAFAYCIQMPTLPSEQLHGKVPALVVAVELSWKLPLPRQCSYDAMCCGPSYRSEKPLIPSPIEPAAV